MKLGPYVSIMLALAGCDDALDLVHVDSPDGGVASDAVTIPDGLVAWLPMDAITTTTEELVAGHHPTCLQLSCPTATAGVRAGALAFDGMFQRLDVPPFSELQTTSGFTVSVWLRADALPPADSYACAVSKVFATTDSSWRVCLNGPDNRLEMAAGNNLLAIGTPSTGTWTHLVGVWDSSTFRLYVNDAPIGTATNTTVMFDTGPVVIGAGEAGGIVYPFQGAVDDVRIYNRVLSSAEIHELFVVR